MVYLPVKSCHVTLNKGAGTFSPPTFSSIQTNNWCNWTIWAGPRKHILIYIEGFERKPDCEENQDKILFQGIRSSVENKVVYACRNHGTLIFATQAEAAHVVFLSKASSQNHSHKYFKGWYYIFEDYEMSTSAVGDVVVPEEPVLKYNSSIEFPSYIIHSRHISDLENDRIPSNENSLLEEKSNKTKNAPILEALLRPAARNYASVSFSKPTKNVTLHDLELKEMQVMKPPTDEHRINDTFSGGLKKTGVLVSNSMEDTEKAISPPAPLYDSQKFRIRTEVVVAGVTRDSPGVENNMHWRSTHMKDAERAKFEKSDFPSGVTIPQLSLKEPRPPVFPPKSIPEEKQQPHAVISTKVSDAIEFPYVVLKEAARGERMVVFPGNLKNTQAEMAVSSYPENSVRGYTGCSQRKCTKSNPPYIPLSEWPSSDETPLDKGQANNSHVESILVFSSPENDSVLEYQHKPGDILLEVTFGIEHQGRIPHNGSRLGEDLIESVKMQVHERVKFLSNKVKEIKLKEIRKKEGSERKRMNYPNLLFTFWLHLVPEENNISGLIHSHLEGLGGTFTGSGEIRHVSVGDVNECSSGIELCGDDAICLNGYGTYLCQCKEEYEDRSLTKSGTLCVRSPPSGLRFLYSYMEIFVGTMIFFISAIVVVISVLCTIVKKRRTKKDLSFPEAALSRAPAASHSQSTTFDQNNVRNLLTLDPARLKLRAKSPEWPLQLRSSPTEVCRVSVEQSECL
ncbi:uncharacterized protein LOC129341179 [Eublepharis macularius]|uniref:Uncharacterized protein LOC129341179 n=1 Tax=Eublepharis macularius TaxID=481883 RepID=A0AA97LDT7_EUBMA|nr:uncharacterized protein LOC129341179 [Eublepharis macularius]